MEFWENWIQDVGGAVIKSAADAKFKQPYELERLRLQQLGQGGMYKEGQPGIEKPNGLANPNSISPVMLLLIAGVLVFAMSQD